MSTNIWTRSRTCAKCNRSMTFTWDSHEPDLQQRGEAGLICTDCRVAEDNQVVLK